MISIEEKKEIPKVSKKDTKAKASGPYVRVDNKKHKITCSHAYDIDPSSIEEGSLKGETCIKI